MPKKWVVNASPLIVLARIRGVCIEYPLSDFNFNSIRDYAVAWPPRSKNGIGEPSRRVEPR
jgi:hypothetical protein